MPERALIVGVGNRFRRDDGLGPWVADRLADRGMRAISYEGDGTGLIELFRHERALVLIDATCSGAAPGTHFRFDPHVLPLPAQLFRKSTHEFALAEAIELTRRLHRLPPILLVHGIEGRDFGIGPGLSPPVRAAAGRLVGELTPVAVGR